jgi:hypothetical protein
MMKKQTKLSLFHSLLPRLMFFVISADARIPLAVNKYFAQVAKDAQTIPLYIFHKKAFYPYLFFKWYLTNNLYGTYGQRLVFGDYLVLSEVFQKSNFALVFHRPNLVFSGIRFAQNFRQRVFLSISFFIALQGGSVLKKLLVVFLKIHSLKALQIKIKND